MEGWHQGYLGSFRWWQSGWGCQSHHSGNRSQQRAGRWNSGQSCHNHQGWRWLPENYRQALSSDTWQLPITWKRRFPKRGYSSRVLKHRICRHPWWGASPTHPRSSARRISSRRRRAPKACHSAKATNLGEEDKRQTEENCWRFRHHHGRWIAFADTKKILLAMMPAGFCVLST